MAITTKNTKPSSGLAGLQDKAGLWPLRAAWLLAPVLAGSGIGVLIQRFGDTGRTLTEGWFWLLWFAGMLAALVPTTLSLTAIRVLAPGLGITLLITGVLEGFGSSILLGVVYSIVATGVAYMPIVGDQMVNGSAYGSERRMALRPPAFALAGPIQLAFGAVIAGLGIGPWLIAAGRYWLGVPLLILGLGLAWAGFRVLHQLARRWLVFVPAGFVIHDHVQLVESILMQRSTVVSLGLVTSSDIGETPDGSLPVTDLTAGSNGMPLVATLSEPTSFGQRIKREVVNSEASRIMFSPSLPGAALAEARIRAIPIGSSD